MPPKTRTNKATKALKENVCSIKSNHLQKYDRGLKPPRKALADKTNSASDDNASVLVTEKLPQIVAHIKQKSIIGKNTENDARPRRARRLPNRYKENNVLKKLSNNDVTLSISTYDSLESKKKSVDKKEVNPLKNSPIQMNKVAIVVISPLKSPVNEFNGSLMKKRPKRVCRLPSKFEDHSISPNKFIPLHPINASTPLANKTKKVNKVQKISNTKISSLKVSNVKQKTLNDFFNNSKPSNTNNDANQKKQKPRCPFKSSLPKPKSTVKKISEKNLSIRILDDNKKSLKRDSSKLDVYEFTFDPEEEPPPAKKKKKKTVAKKPAQPRSVKLKSNYDKNLAKALAELKNTVTLKPGKENVNQTKTANNRDALQIMNVEKDMSIVNERNYNSVRVEDIAMDMQPGNISIDYSPVNSPHRPATPQIDSPRTKRCNDPLNLQENISFFDEQPAASSSMNVSIKHPLASPWRVEFGNLPIKWQANTYVKPNMTPAVESSFINSNESQRKHIYTNMVGEVNDTLPEILESTPNLKQTSIMSFIKEVIDKSASRKKVKSTPVKANSLFEDITNTSIVSTHKKQSLTIDPKVATPEKSSSTAETNDSSNTTNQLDNSDNQDNLENSRTPKDRNKESEKNVTYFGFDSEDQENISPKKKNKARSLKSRSRGILQELNTQKGPMRAILPVSVKSKPIQSEVNKLLDGMKSATEPPVFPEVVESTEITKVTEPNLPEIIENDDSESVHLFEDIEFLHHHKPSRKSYGKPKKVAFNKPSTIDSDSSPLSDIDRAASDEDLDDLSFKLPSEKPKKTMKRKKTNKQKLSKKEEKEVEAWAAGFNSMCEDVDEFHLIVE